MTIGSARQGSPTIEDNVYIGCGAKIIGKVIVGENARIGANCTVVKDIPSNSVCVSGQNRIITKAERLNNQWVEVKV